MGPSNRIQRSSALAVCLAAHAIVCASHATAQDADATDSTEVRCPARPGAWLGDPVLLDLAPGRVLADLDGVADAGAPDGDDIQWIERERLHGDLYDLVVVEWPGNEAALVVLRPIVGGWCVHAGWGWSFGGLGVVLHVADRRTAGAQLELIAIEAIATFNNPADDLSDPEVPRRIVLAVSADRAAVVADSDEPRFARHARDSWLVGDSSLRIVTGNRVIRWRFDPRTWVLRR